MTDIPNLRKLLELAERVESLTRPDLEVDALIRCAVLAPPGSWVKQSQFNRAWCIYDGKRPSGAPRLWEPFGLSDAQRLGAFTASLDAAMSLVPDGWSFEVRSSGSGDKGQASVWNPMRAPGHSEVRVTGCASPALALTAAALRARAALSETQADEGRG